MTDTPALVSDATAVAGLAAAIARAGWFAFDLEFVSADRYVPELALVQVAWGDPAAPEVAAVDPLAGDPGPIFDLVADPAVEVVAHAARQDLGLLHTTYGVTARAFVDTQIAASFGGMPDQLGYARMVQQLFGVALDKGPQHTDWRRRPLSDRQVRYALDDVRHLPMAWQILRERLEKRGRMSWAREESERLATNVVRRRPAEEAYRQVGGWAALKGAALPVLVALAAWRERVALSSNTPPSWIAADPVLIELARRAPRDEADLVRVRGLPRPVQSRYGAEILAAIDSRSEAFADVVAPPVMAPAAQVQAQVVLALLQARCCEEDVPVRLVGGRGDAEALVTWFIAGATGDQLPRGGSARSFHEGAAGIPALAEGWRHELAGQHALSWLRGERSLFADLDRVGGLRASEPEAEPDVSLRT